MRRAARPPAVVLIDEAGWVWRMSGEEAMQPVRRERVDGLGGAEGRVANARVWPPPLDVSYSSLHCVSETHHAVTPQEELLALLNSPLALPLHEELHIREHLRPTPSLPLPILDNPHRLALLLPRLNLRRRLSQGLVRRPTVTALVVRCDMQRVRRRSEEREEVVVSGDMLCIACSLSLGLP